MKLLHSIQLGKLRLRNGVVMAPMTRNRADHQGIVGESTRRYYVQRASAGLIITEATNISPEAKGYPMTPGIWSTGQVEACRESVVLGGYFQENMNNFENLALPFRSSRVIHPIGEYVRLKRFTYWVYSDFRDDDSPCGPQQISQEAA